MIQADDRLSHDTLAQDFNAHYWEAKFTLQTKHIPVFLQVCSVYNMFSVRNVIRTEHYGWFYTDILYVMIYTNISLTHHCHNSDPPSLSLGPSRPSPDSRQIPKRHTGYRGRSRYTYYTT